MTKAADTKIAKINPAALRELREAFNEALKSVGEKYGVQMRTGSGSYATEGTSGHLKVEITLGSNEKELADSARKSFEAHAMKGYIEPEWYGQHIVLNGTAFTVHAINPRARKNEIVIKRVSDGGLMVTGAATVRAKIAVASVGKPVKPVNPKTVTMMPVKEFTRIANEWEIPAWWRGQVVSFGVNALVIVSLDENAESDEWIMATDALGNSKAFTYAEVAAQLGE